MSKIYPDISHHHPVRGWTSLAVNCPFVISKATEGQTYIDPTLTSFIKNCEAKKIPYWLYTFLRKGNEKAQAEFMVKTCKNKVGKYFIGYILDVESNNSAANVKGALDYINGLGYKTMIYTMYAQYSKYKSVIAGRGSNCAWWEARYGINNGFYSSKYSCHSGVDLHQYTSRGKCPGISDKIDLNRITGMGKSEGWFTTRLDTKEDEGTTKTETKVSYYPKCASSLKSIADALRSINVNNTFENRSKIAKANGIENYKGTANQNIQMLGLLKAGKLKKV